MKPQAVITMWTFAMALVAIVGVILADIAHSLNALSGTCP